MSGSLIPFVRGELQIISSECKRKNPAVKEVSQAYLGYPSIWQAADEVLSLLTGIERLPDDGSKASSILAEKVNILRVLKLAGSSALSAKLMPHSIAILHRLISHAALPISSVPQILELLDGTSAYGDDVKLRGLQCVMPLLAHFSLHQDYLFKSYRICFNLLTSKSSTVSNAAIAIIRQLVIWLFERVVEEDAVSENQGECPVTVAKADGTSLELSPYAADAYSILQDICLLASGKPALALPITSLNCQFALELIESVLHDNPDLFRRRKGDFLLLLKERMCPLLLNLLPRQHEFSVACRLWRIANALLQNFCDSMPSEATSVLCTLVGTLEDSQIRWELCLALEVAKDVMQAPAITREVAMLDSTKLTELIVAVCNIILGVLAQFKNVDFTLTKAQIRLPLLQQFDRVTSPSIDEVQLVFAAFKVLSNILKAHRKAIAAPPTALNGTSQTLVGNLWASMLRAFKCLLTNARLDMDWRKLTLDSMADLIFLEAIFSLREPLNATLTNLAEVALPEIDESSANTSSEALILNDVNLSASLYVLRIGSEMGEYLQSSWAPIVHVLHGIDQLNVYRIKRSNSIISLPRKPSAPTLVSGDMDILGQITEQARLIIEGSSHLSPPAFVPFFQAICSLASELLSASGTHHSRLQETVVLFPFQKVKQIGLLNVYRYCDPEMPESQQAWDLLIEALGSIIRHENPALVGLACESVSLLVTQFSTKVDPEVFANKEQLQQRIFSALEKFSSSTDSQEVQRTIQESLHRLLQHLGPNISTGWRYVFNILGKVTESRETTLPLVKSAYASIKLVCAEFISLLSAPDRASLVAVVSQVARNSSDLNMRLTAIGLLWDISDHARNVPDEALWLKVLGLLIDFSLSEAPEVRDSALQTITRIIDIRSGSLGLVEWEELLGKIITKVIEKIPKKAQSCICGEAVTHSLPMLDSPSSLPQDGSLRHQWDETLKLLMAGVTQLYSKNLETLVKIPGFSHSYWDSLLRLFYKFCLEGSSDLASSAVACFYRLVEFQPKTSNTKLKLEDKVGREVQSISDAGAEIWKKAWSVWCEIGSITTREEGGNFNQDSLLCFTRIYPHLLAGFPTDLQILSTSWGVLAQVLKCHTPSDPVKDADNMTELQRLIFNLLEELNQVDGAVALQIEILATWVSWLKPVDIVVTRTDSLRRSRSSTPCSTPVKARADGPTFFALCRATLEKLESLIPLLCEQPKEFEIDAIRGALEAVGRLATKKYFIPHGGPSGALSLWKLATKTMNTTLIAVFNSQAAATAELQNPAIKLIDKVLQVAGTMVPIDISLDQLEVDERFDIEELCFVRETLLPKMTHSDPALVKDLICTIEHNSHLYVPKNEVESRLACLEVKPVIKEKFAVACLYSLFAICTDGNDDRLPSTLDRSGSFGSLFVPNISSGIRKIALPTLVERCRKVLASYVFDKTILGRMPFPRVRQDEMLYILNALNRLRLPPDSTLPSLEGEGALPAMRRQLLASPRGHLFFLYPNYCELLRIEEPLVIAAVQEAFRIIGSELGIMSLA